MTEAERSTGEQKVPLLLTRDGASATITIDRPHRRNAVDLPTLCELGRLVRDLAASDDVTSLVLRGAGGVFCAGADVGDLGVLLQQSDARLRAEFDEQLDALDALAGAPFVTIASIDGVALGFGVALAACCDVVIAAEQTKLGLPEVSFGMAPAMVVDALLRRVRPGAAIRFAAGGQSVNADEAQRLGLVDRVVNAAELEAVTAELVAEFARHDAAAVRHTVELIRLISTGDAPDLGMESCRAVRSPVVAERLAAMIGKSTVP